MLCIEDCCIYRNYHLLLLVFIALKLFHTLALLFRTLGISYVEKHSGKIWLSQ